MNERNKIPLLNKGAKSKRPCIVLSFFENHPRLSDPDIEYERAFLHPNPVTIPSLTAYVARSS
jgi:hypothetical protein